MRAGGPFSIDAVTTLGASLDGAFSSATASAQASKPFLSHAASVAVQADGCLRRRAAAISPDGQCAGLSAATDGTEFDRDQPCADHAPDENKSGQANHLLHMTGVCRSKDFIDAPTAAGT